MKRFPHFSMARWIMIGWLAGLMLSALPVYAQGPATPIQVVPPTATATNLPPTEPPTRTPTSLGPASAIALSEGTNVRSQPDISGERVGQISPGQNYAVLGKRFEWYQIQFPDAPGGTGWVHESVVQIVGDANLIPDFSEVPTENPTISTGRLTQEAVTLTPGFGFTLTAEAQITPTGVFTIGADSASNPNAPFSNNSILPTFTFPPETATPINLSNFRGDAPTRAQGGMPPIVPILALVGVGGVGLLLSFLRRA